LPSGVSKPPSALQYGTFSADAQERRIPNKPGLERRLTAGTRPAFCARQEEMAVRCFKVFLVGKYSVSVLSLRRWDSKIAAMFGFE
jgi:hypothetical protein